MERWCALCFFPLGFPTDGQPLLLAVARTRCEIVNSTHSSVLLPRLSFIFDALMLEPLQALFRIQIKMLLFICYRWRELYEAFLCHCSNLCVESWCWFRRIPRQEALHAGFLLLLQNPVFPPKTVHGSWTFLLNPNWKKLCFTISKATVTIRGSDEAPNVFLG